MGALLLAGGLPALHKSKMVTLAEVAQGKAGANIWVSGTVAAASRRRFSAGVMSGRVEWIAGLAQPGEGGDELLRWTARPAPLAGQARAGTNRRGNDCVALAPRFQHLDRCTNKSASKPVTGAL